MSVKQRIARAISMEAYIQGLTRDGLEELIVMARGRLVVLNEEAAEREWGRLALLPESRDACEEKGWNATIEGKRYAESTASAMPLAICEAALKAKGVL